MVTLAEIHEVSQVLARFKLALPKSKSDVLTATVWTEIGLVW